MTKKLNIILLLSTLLLTACSNSKIANNFKNDSLSANALQNSQKTDIVIENRVNVMFTATYLNEVDSQFNDGKENFIISVYKINSEKININDLQVKLDTKSPLQIEVLSKEHIMREKLPLKNKWATFYLVSFNKSEEKSKKLTLNYKGLEIKTLMF